MPRRTVFETEHEEFRAVVRDFLEREVRPFHDQWEVDGQVDPEVYRAAAKAGVQGFNVPEEFGGLGLTDWRYNAVVVEEVAASGLHGPGITLNNDIVAPYLLRLATDEQKDRWLRGLASGDLVFAIAMSEPAAGSDLAGIRTSARRDGDDWILSGQKTFISNGLTSDVVIVVARTDPEAGHKGFSLLCVERGMPGFARGRRLEKLGLHAQDTAELFFDEVRIPAGNLLGHEGRGFYHLMENLAEERLSIAVAAVAAARQVLDQTLSYVKERTAFGTPVGSFQANRFLLAELDTELDVARAYVDDCVRAVLDGTLTATDAAKAKWWTTELQVKVVDRCVQLHGGYGYMTEYPVARAFLDARIQTIYGGSSEVMKELIGRELGL
jgi:alkylation response protein AidB-like acyl-CoA dehydrogenase